MTWVTGQELQNGKYVIQQVLGQGGFGITYQALQVNLKRSVVIKTPNEYLQHDPDYEKYIEKFIAEGQILAELSKDPHPHIVGVIELFQEGNTYCLVMEFIPGENLFQVINRSGALPEAEIITYIRQIGAALIKVHKAGLVHRDTHPRNIMIRNNSKAVLIDFGIAKEIIFLSRTLTDRDANREFAPYEQIFKGSRDPRVDIYCLAASLYYGVTGQYPTNSLARKVGRERLIPPQKIISGISKELNQAILKGMALEARDRPKSMQLWLEMLNYKSQIPNKERKVSNVILNIVSVRKNIVNIIIKFINRGKNIVNVTIKIVNAGTNIVNAVLIRNTEKSKVVYPDRKPARTIPWVSLTILLLNYCIIGFTLTLVNAPFWLWAVLVPLVLVWAVAFAWEVAVALALVWAVIVVAFVAKAVVMFLAAAVAVPALLAEEKLRKSFSKFHAFLILAGTSNIGLGLGWIVYKLLTVL
ncbi:serine/threonine protein kinase [Anabaena sp. WA102]|jgi:serine/threonine-protein kinase|uniref:serine/threonine protein kinase n=1 Tax=Anabaena sp. WA102 TaxID=1647413 RepID=UPI0006AC7617|nr:serine/threonine-protein kinase [Anabaena sp. WA102]ALB43264.1 serine/threonine protein kinase [Anabaena sp. WA102]